MFVVGQLDRYAREPDLVVLEDVLGMIEGQRSDVGRVQQFEPFVPIALFECLGHLVSGDIELDFVERHGHLGSVDRLRPVAESEDVHGALVRTRAPVCGTSHLPSAHWNGSVMRRLLPKPFWLPLRARYEMSFSFHHQFIDAMDSMPSSREVSSFCPVPLIFLARNAVRMPIVVMNAVPYDTVGWPMKMGPSRCPVCSAICPRRALSSAS